MTAGLAHIVLNNAVPLAKRQAIDLLMEKLTFRRSWIEYWAFVWWPKVNFKRLLYISVTRRGVCQNTSRRRIV